jgi:hypothetical protein
MDHTACKCCASGKLKLYALLEVYEEEISTRKVRMSRWKEGRANSRMTIAE